jgi:glycosyltransferase involved in cell wall biosynthesis
MGKNILYISYDGLTDPLGQSQILPYVIGLSEKGYNLFILSFEKPKRYEAEKNIIDELLTGTKITWLPQKFNTKPPVLSKWMDRYRMIQLAKSICVKEKIGMVHCRSYIAAEAGLQIKQELGIPFLFDMRGYWVDEKKDTGHWPQTNFFYRRLYRYYKRKETVLLQQADHIISLTENAQQDLIQRYPNLRDGITVIPCCADLHHFDYNRIGREESKAARKTLGLSDTDNVIVYLGSLGTFYCLEEMLSFYLEAYRQNPNYVLLIYTKDDTHEIKNQLTHHGVPEHRVITKYVKRAELPLFLSFARFSIFFIKDYYSKKASSPTKHAELMGMGLPVICNNIGDTGEIVRRTQSGVVLNEFSERGYQVALQEMTQFESDRNKIRQAALNFFSVEMGIERYVKVYQIICNS